MSVHHILKTVLFGFLLITFSCVEKSQDHEKRSELYEVGSAISSEVQSALLSEVGGAMKKGGTEYAVGFCNMKVVGIVDSFNRKYNCQISRVSERNRNPENNLKTETEKAIWRYYLLEKPEEANDTIVFDNGNPVFLSPIRISNPVCLNCHGMPDDQIDGLTLSKIDSLYPNDLARYYQLGDLRGMWKIVFEEGF